MFVAESSPALPLVFAAVFIVLGLAILVWAVVETTRFRRVADVWPGAQATLVDFEQQPSDDSSVTYARVFAFQSMEGRAVRGTAIGGLSSTSRNGIGTFVRVIYDPADAERFYTLPRQGTWLLPLVGGLFTAVGVGLVALASSGVFD